MDAARTRTLVDGAWDESILPVLQEYIRIPNKSPHFDADWEAAGHMDRALDLIVAWSRENSPPGADIQVHRLKGRTPVILIDVPGRGLDDSVLMYGHFDKQPEITGWREGLGPWTPVLEGDRLYGRGAADDGYSTFAALTAIRAVHEQGLPHARCVILIEACEESGSFDLPPYLEALRDAIGTPSLVVCLDSGCGNYEQLWGTTSLRGLVAGTLSVELLSEGVHSGTWSGVVASSFRITRMLLDRIEDKETGRVLLSEFHVEVPQDRLNQIDAMASEVGAAFHSEVPMLAGVEPMADGVTDLILNSTWRPTLSVTGVAGIPPLENAGNVLRPVTKLKLSLRVPPTCDSEVAGRVLKQALEADPPYGARVSFELDQGADGWNAPSATPWFSAAIDAASEQYFGKPAAYKGEGGSIPFMATLGERFPEAQFLVTGVLGPGANAHGPNEFLHIPAVKNLTCCVASVLAAHALK